MRPCSRVAVTLVDFAPAFKGGVTLHSLSTAIIYLREPAHSGVLPVIAPALRMLRGVIDFEFVPAESLIAVRFNRHETGLAEIVRTIEDAGSGVSSVAQRTAA